MRIIILVPLLLLGCGSPVSAFRRRFGIFSAAVTTTKASNNNNNNNSSNGSSSRSLTKSNKKENVRVGRNEEKDWSDELQSQSNIDDGDGNDDNQYYRAVPVLDDDEEEEEDSLLDDLQLHPMLEIPVSMTLTGVLYADDSPVRTFLDTGAMRTVMTWNTASKLGVLQHLDRRYAGEATGVGSCRVLGRLPAGLFTMHLTLSSSKRGETVTVPSPAITILESSSSSLPEVELLLGLDFLREYKAVVDLRQEELRVLVGQHEHSIAFLRPKGSSVKHASSRKKRRRNDEDDDDDDDEYDDEWHEHMRKSNYINDSHLYDNDLYNKRFLDEDEPTDYEDMPDMSGI